MVEQSSDPRRSGGQSMPMPSSKQLVEHTLQYTPKKEKIVVLCEGSSGPE